MAQQGPGPLTAQGGLPTLGGLQGHVEAVLHVGRPRQEFLQRREVKTDGFGGVLVIISSWSEEGTMRNRWKVWDPQRCSDNNRGRKTRPGRGGSAPKPQE